MNQTKVKKVTAYLHTRLAKINEEAATIEALLKGLEPIKVKIKREEEPFIDWQTEIAKAIMQNGGVCTKAEITRSVEAKLDVTHQAAKNEVSMALLFNKQKRFVKQKEGGHYQYTLNAKR